MGSSFQPAIVGAIARFTTAPAWKMRRGRTSNAQAARVAPQGSTTSGTSVSGVR
jgi:hypothetical protein